MNLRLTLSLTILIAALGLLGIAESAPSRPIEMELGMAPGVTDSQDLVVAYLTKLIAERSHGRIRISNSATVPALAEQPLNWLNRQPGRLALLPMTDLVHQISVLRVYELPFLCRDLERLSAAIKDWLGRPLSADKSTLNPVLLSVWPGRVPYLTGDIPVLSPDSVSKAIYRGLPENPASGYLQRLSVNSAEELPGSRRPAWQETTWPEFMDRDNLARPPHVTLSRHRLASWVLITSDEFWEQLPDDLRIIVLDTGAAAANYARELVERAEQEALRVIRSDHQLQVHELTRSQWQQWHMTLMKFYDKLGKDEGAKELHQMLQLCSVH